MTWSSTVVMKIDLIGEKDRGFAMGLNEFAGYFAVGIFAFISAYIAQEFGVRPYPFLLGTLVAVLGLVLTVFFCKRHPKTRPERIRKAYRSQLEGNLLGNHLQKQNAELRHSSRTCQQSERWYDLGTLARAADFAGFPAG